MPASLPVRPVFDAPRRLLATLFSAAALLGLAGCGGGEVAEPFRPTRVVAFGDENAFMRSRDSAGTASVAQDDGSNTSATAPGRRYSINVVTGSPAVTACDESSTATWFQRIAARYGIAFKGCSFATSAPATAQTWATEGATAATISSAISQYAATQGGFRDGDLVLLMAGVHDVLNAYTLHTQGQTLDVLRNQLIAAGQQLGNRVADMKDAGAHVLLFTTPDLGLSPFALSENGGSLNVDLTYTAVDCQATNPANAQQWLSVLTDCFNYGLRSTPRLQGAGRKVALVRTDIDLRRVASSPSSYGFANATGSACLSGNAVPACLITMDSTGLFTDFSHMVSTTAYADYYWADSTWMTPGAHSRIASLAISQLQTNGWE